MEIRLTDPEQVKVRCVVVDESAGIKKMFKHFILVGFDVDEGETLVVAADLRDYAKGLKLLIETYKHAFGSASPEVQMDVEIDILLNEVWGPNSKP